MLPLNVSDCLILNREAVFTLRQHEDWRRLTRRHQYLIHRYGIGGLARDERLNQAPAVLLRRRSKENMSQCPALTY